jgi:hypothetical protein
LNEKQSETSLKSSRFVREETGRKVMRENEPVLLVFSVCEGEIILEKGEILSEKRQLCQWLWFKHFQYVNTLAMQIFSMRNYPLTSSGFHHKPASDSINTHLKSRP